jgi:hypothetical protein
MPPPAINNDRSLTSPSVVAKTRQGEIIILFYNRPKVFEHLFPFLKKYIMVC